MNQFLLLFFRNIKNNPKMFLINIFSFSVGIVTVLFIYLFVAKEFSADKFHPKHQDIYRVIRNRVNANTQMSNCSYPIGDLLREKHSDIVNYTRYSEFDSYTVKTKTNSFSDQKLTYVDKAFFELFDFKLAVGTPELIFNTSNSVFISKAYALKYFNSLDVLGKTFMAGFDDLKEYIIVGILDDYPEESTLQPQIVLDINEIAQKYQNNYFSSSPQVFLYIPHCSNISNLSEAISLTIQNKQNEFRRNKCEITPGRIFLQKLDDMYLHSNAVEDNLKKGNHTLLWILTGIGLLLLGATFVNYLILTLGLNLKKLQQHHIRNILGSSSWGLQKRYIYESVFYSTFAFIVSILLLPVLYYIITSFVDFRYSLKSWGNPGFVSIFLGVLVLIGATVGFIQYLAITNRKTTGIQQVKFSKGHSFFKYLVQFQLLVFIVATMSLFMLKKQVSFIQTEDLGFNMNNTVSVRINDTPNMKLFYEECKKLSSVKHVSIGHTLVRKNACLNEITVDGTDNVVNAQTIFGDDKYLATYQIKLISGTNINGEKLPSIEYYGRYNRENTLDILVNQEFVDKSGLTNPLGTLVTINHNGTSKGRIVGIIDNVRNLPFYNPITPMVIGFGFSHGPSIIVSVHEGQMEAFTSEVKKFLTQINSNGKFGYGTYDVDIMSWYQKETLLIQLMTVFSIILLIILCLGLLGISLFISENKTKEIGIRKVNGAKVGEILALFNRDFVKWVIIAFVIATPIAYYAMNKWLKNFAYKTELSWWIFALAGVMALGIALLTVSFQSWKAASRNPVEALRYE